jgi:hypothetical protein
MPSLFEWLDKINTGKDIALNEDDPYKDYPTFQILQGLSQNLDTILLANEMNKRPGLSKEMQFKFLDKSIIKKKRFGKWAKVEEEANKADIEVVSEFYQVNRNRAKEYLKLINPTELDYMRKRVSKGGSDTIGKGRKK